MKPLLQLLLFVSLPLIATAQTKTDTKLYPSLKAVLVVGHTEGLTESSIQSMNKIAEFLRKKGIKTYCFYDSAADWQKISVAAKGAHFFIYNGHGSRGGGLNIERGGTTEDILNLSLAKNAVIGFQSVCYGAGSSAGDDAEISHAEAVERVNWYAEPFLKAGAGCYFANNWNDGVLNFLQRLLEEESKPFEAYKTDNVIPYSPDKTKMIGLRSINLGGTTTRISYKNGVKTVQEVPSHKSFEVAWVSSYTFSIKDIIP